MSETSNVIPQTSYDYMRDTKFKQILRNLKTHQMMDFAYKYPLFIRKADQQQAQSHLRYIAGSQIICLLTGIFLNVKLKSFYPDILNQPRPLRWAYRTVVLAVPIVTGYFLVTKPTRNKLNALLDDMHQRLVTLGKDENIQNYYKL